MGQGNYEWLRMEVRTAGGDFLAYVNPVYFGHRTPSLKTFGDAVAAARSKGILDRIGEEKNR